MGLVKNGILEAFSVVCEENSNEKKNSLFELIVEFMFMKTVYDINF